MIITALVCNSVCVKEIVLSSNTGKEVMIEKYAFRLLDSYPLFFENIGSELFIHGTESFMEISFLEGRGEINDPLIIGNDSRVTLMTAAGEKLYIFVYFKNNERMCFFDTAGKESISIGRGIDNIVCFMSLGHLSMKHLKIERRGREVLLIQEGANGCYVNNIFLGKSKVKPLYFGDEIILCGIKILWLEEIIGFISYGENKNDPMKPLIVRLTELDIFDVSLQGIELCKPEGSGCTLCKPIAPGEDFYPIPRTIKRFDMSPFVLDPPPHKEAAGHESLFLTVGPALTMAFPMLLGSLLAVYGNKKNTVSGQSFMYTGLITAVLAAVLGAFWAAGNLNRRRREIKKKENRRKRAYADYLYRTEEEIKRRYETNREILYFMYPCLDILSSSMDRACLWNKSREDEDFLRVRLGTGTYPFPALNLDVPRERFSLDNDSLLKLPGMLKEKYGFLKEVPLYLDLSENEIFGIVSGDREFKEEILFSILLQLCYFIGSDKLHAAICITSKISSNELRMLRFLPQLWHGDEYHLALSFERRAEVFEDLKQLIEEDRELSREREYLIFTDSCRGIREFRAGAAKIRTILLAESFEELPEGCCRIIMKEKGFSGIVNTRDTSMNLPLMFDQSDRKKALGLVRILGGLRNNSLNEHRKIPELIYFHEIMECTPGELYEKLIYNWKNRDAIKGMRVPVGMGGDGKICFLDPHESAHGPHGLIAGMTGSGKSEILQTFILSLAFSFPPEKVAFFLIDYKGGGMAGLFEGLPHLAGSISNLSGNDIYRAMVSIKSETERRQRLFLEAGVNRIGEYEKKYSEKEVKDALPHLFIIIDEFAELKKNEPEFMRELVSVALVGRSLGVHLILATQKPQGTVDDKIWSNSRFRICLRVQDRQDSMDMLHKPDAAMLTNVGRAFLQVGNDELYTEFQSAYTMAVREMRESREYSVYDDEGRMIKKYLKDEDKTGSKDGSPSDFLIIKAYIERAAAELSSVRAGRLWMEGLKSNMTVPMVNEKKSYSYPLGIYDAPKRQEQAPFEADLLEGGHHAVLGRSGCGKSTFLETLLSEIVKRETPDTLRAYVIDMSNGMLSVFKESRIVGDYLERGDKEKISNLFYMIRKEMSKRREDFKGINFSLKKKLENGPEAIVLVIDGIGAFREEMGDEYDRYIEEILKTGEAFGIYLILTGNRIGPQDLPLRLHEAVKTVICLSLSDRTMLSMALRVSRIELRPDDSVPGRGIAFVGQELLEFQTGLCFMGNDYERREDIRKLIELRNISCKDKRAARVPFIPDSPVLGDLIELTKACSRKELLRDQGLIAGYRVKGGEPFFIPLDDTGSFVISGGRRSGRTNLLKVIKESAAYFGYELKSVCNVSGFTEALKDHEKGGILIDDFSGLLTEIYADKEKEEDVIELIEKNRENGLHKLIYECSREDTLFLSGRKLLEVLKRDAYGIHLGGLISEQTFFDFPDLSFTKKNQKKEAGEGDVPFIKKGLFFGEVRIPLWSEIREAVS